MQSITAWRYFSSADKRLGNNSMVSEWPLLAELPMLNSTTKRSRGSTARKKYLYIFGELELLTEQR